MFSYCSLFLLSIFLSACGTTGNVLTMPFLRLGVGGASITEPWFIRHLRGTTTEDVIAGIKILCSRICNWRRPVGWIPHSCRLTMHGEKEEGGRNSKSHKEGRPKGLRCITRLTSANVLDWWMLFVSQICCSFCFSRDRVSWTDFREASTEKAEGHAKVLMSVHNLFPLLYSNIHTRVLVWDFAKKMFL